MRNSARRTAKTPSNRTRSGFKAQKDLLLEYALEGRQEEAHAIMGAALKRSSAREIYLQILIPALRDLGTAWAKGKITIAQEHIATEIIASEVSALRCTFNDVQSNGYSALFAALPGDLHTLGPRVVADFFLMDGWKVSFLGNNTPAHEIINFARNQHIDIVGLSVSSSKNVKEISDLISQLRELPEPPKVMLGGRASETLSQISPAARADAYPKDAQDAVRQARRLVGNSAAPQTLKSLVRDIGLRIRAERGRRELSQADLSRAAHLDRAYLSAIENGKHNATIGALLQIANALAISLQELLGDCTSRGHERKDL